MKPWVVGVSVLGGISLAWSLGTARLVFDPAIGGTGSRDVDATLASAAWVAPDPNDPELDDPKSDLYARYFVYSDAYYATVDHTRIDVSRPRGANEPAPEAIRSLGATYGEGRPNELYAGTLEVQAVANVPVTFFAPDHGVFENDQRAITVKADAHGRAAVKFRFGPLASTYRIVAASPETRGTASFRLEALTEREARERSVLLGGK
ncbi:MAG: hypothetical protein L6Q99_10390 [Planctomycetes bacterium]|nr:hypothetical protein [Planctomycetota bacterium]